MNSLFPKLQNPDAALLGTSEVRLAYKGQIPDDIVLVEDTQVQDYSTSQGRRSFQKWKDLSRSDFAWYNRTRAFQVCSSSSRCADFQLVYSCACSL